MPQMASFSWVLTSLFFILALFALSTKLYYIKP